MLMDASTLTWDVTLRPLCSDAACGTIELGRFLILFAKGEASSTVIDLPACGGTAFDLPAGGLDAAQACLMSGGGGCEDL